MISQLQEMGKYTSSGLTFEEKNELDFLRKEIAKIRNEHTEDQENFSNESSEDEEDEMNQAEIQTMQENQKKRAAAKRVAVSAEAYGEYNKKEDFVPKVIEKTDEQKQKIKVRIVNSFLFSALDNENLNIVINAMDMKNVSEGENVITQGESGDCLYVVESGQLDCTKHFTPDGEEKHLKTYIPGEAFGELALLYNAPRAATIRAKENCELWVLDRETFNNIVKTAAQKKRDKYSQILKKVEILQSIDPYELQQICDAVQSSSFQKGDNIIKEGENGDIFYILEEGTAVATKTLEEGKEPQEIKQYVSGEYFGERALVKGEPRYCNITVTSDIAKVLSLDRSSFKRLLGPIEDILQRNIEQYKKYLPND